MNAPTQTQLDIKGNALQVPLRVRPSLSSARLTLESDDGAFTLKCPSTVFPFAVVGEVVIVTLGLLQVLPKEPEPASNLILPPGLVAN